jgi:hypothetical protein
MSDPVTDDLDGDPVKALWRMVGDLRPSLSGG